jgi:hypothetical protein
VESEIETVTMKQPGARFSDSSVTSGEKASAAFFADRVSKSRSTRSSAYSEARVAYFISTSICILTAAVSHITSIFKVLVCRLGLQVDLVFETRIAYI